MIKSFASFFLIFQALVFASVEDEFFRVCLNGDTDTFHILYQVEGKRLIHSKDKSGNTPLHLACCSKKGGHKKELIEFLIKEGANVNATNNHMSTPLYIAVSNGNIEGTSALLKASKLKVNQQNPEGFTALHVAVMSQSIPLIEQLLAHPEINPNFGTTDGATPLHFAAMQGLVEEAILLINHPRTNINAPQHDHTYGGATPLHFAAMQAQTEIVKYLVEKGHARVDVALNKGPCGGFTPLHFVVMNPDTVNVLETVKILLKNGANPKTKCVSGNVPYDLTSVSIIQEILKNPKKASCNDY